MAKSFPNTGATVGLAADRSALASPFAGMQFFETDTKALYLYNGSAWVSMLDTDTPPGIVKLTSGSLSGTTTNIVSCFSSVFTNYRLIVNNVRFAGGAADLYFRMLNSTTPFTSGQYYWAYRGLRSDGVSLDSSGGGQTLNYMGITNTVSGVDGNGSYDIFSPFLTNTTYATGIGTGLTSGTGYNMRSGMMAVDNTSSYDGIQLLTNTAPTFTGSYTLYGYN